MSINLEQKSYLDLRSIIKERTKSVVFWTGAGVSAKYNLPTWSQLKELLLKQLQEKIQEVDPTFKNKLEKDYIAIKNEANNWISFSRLKKSLGTTTFRTTIKDALNVELPKKTIYSKLWSLGISGLINSNLDLLAKVGFNNQYPNQNLSSFVGKHIKEYSHLLNSPNKFLLQVHGEMDNISSWVFTNEEMNEMLNTEDYDFFMKTTMISKIVVFIGISADDLTAGGHIKALTDKGYNLNKHFWITDRCDRETDEWAEESGIQLIRYTTEGSHKEISDLLDDLLSYIPIDEEAPVVIPSIKSHEDVKLSTPSDLLYEHSAEVIRQQLNAEATRIFSGDKEKAYSIFNSFIKEYDEVIHRAWYISVEKPKNCLLGFEIDKHVHEGMFGNVYKGRSISGHEVAIKVLKSDVRKKEEYIQGFRRGIQSMRILKEEDIEGMVKIIDASEIPALIVMEWVHGNNLTEIVEKKILVECNHFIYLFLKLAQIISSAHGLPERVLHRDIRPSNIMIEWEDGELKLDKVHVLDFDLSWYKSSIESKEIDFSIGNGFLAPEQLTVIDSVSTRNAAVDSFGLGMTMFYTLSGCTPLPSQHKHKGWKTSVENLSKQYFKQCQWKSVGNRISRMIIKCTQNKQSERWDMSQIKFELSRLMIASKNPSEVKSCDLIAEEIVARSTYNNRYSWDSDELKVIIKPTINIIFELKSNESYRAVDFKMKWTRSTAYCKKQNNRSNTVIDRIAEFLNSKEFTVLSRKCDSNFVEIRSRIKIENAVQNIDNLSDNLSTLSSMFKFN